MKAADQPVCVLVSGGIESSVLLAEAARRGVPVHPVYVRFGLRWEAEELRHLKRFIAALHSDRVRPLKTLSFPMIDVYGPKHWSVRRGPVPGARSADESVYLPGRNILLLAKAACYAVSTGVPVVEIGILKSNPFKDASDGFLKRYAAAVSEGLSRSISFRAPLSRLKKEEVIRLGTGLPLERTFSCLDPKGRDHCGDCNKCTERKRSFFAAGVRDKTVYRKPGIV